MTILAEAERFKSSIHNCEYLTSQNLPRHIMVLFGQGVHALISTDCKVP